jgi:hypothetical protein
MTNAGDNLRWSGIVLLIVSLIAGVIERIFVRQSLPQPVWMAWYPRMGLFTSLAGLILIFLGLLLRERRRREK